MRNVKKEKTKKQRYAWLCTMVAGALLWQAPGITHAAEVDEYELDQVVVTATKTPVKKFEANANITVVTKEKIAQQHYTDLEQALRDVPGVTFYNYGRAGYDITNSLRINGSNNIIVLIDGVRANHIDADLSFPASTYMDLESVERIEILKGSASAIYGADAKGGVINIITRKPQENKSTLKISGGNFSRETYSFTHEGVAGDWAYRLLAKKNLLGDAEDGHGGTIPQSWNADTLRFKISKDIKEGSDIILSYNSYKSNYKYFDEFYGGDLTKGSADNYDWNIIFNYQFDDSAKNTFSFRNSHYEYINDGGALGVWWAWQRKINTLNFSDQFTKKINNRHTVVSGFDYTRAKFVHIDDATLNYKGIYVQDEWSMSDQWKLTTGLRYDDHSLVGSNVTPRVNLGYKVNDRTNYYLSYSEFFVTPTMYQLFDLDHGNGNLKAEDGHSIEFGINHRATDTLTVSSHVFKRKSDNVTKYNYGTAKFYNTDEDATGWDIQLNKQFSDTFSGLIGYTYTHMKEKNGSIRNASGNIPKHALNVGMDYNKGKFDVGVQGRASIDRKGDESIADFFPCDSYWIWDLAVNYQVNKEAKAFVKVNNIFDKFYAEASAVTSSTSGAWYTMPGRNFIVGMEYVF